MTAGAARVTVKSSTPATIASTISIHAGQKRRERMTTILLFDR
jgi:hypothetical protein